IHPLLQRMERAMRASYRYRRATSSAEPHCTKGSRWAALCAMLLAGYLLAPAAAQFAGEDVPGLGPETTNEQPADEEEGAAEEYRDELAPDEAALPSNRPMQLPDPIGMERLSKTDRAWIDVQRNRVLVDGQVSLREGVLEMFACPRNT